MRLCSELFRTSIVHCRCMSVMLSSILSSAGLAGWDTWRAYWSVLCCAVLCCAVLCYAVLCCAVLCCAALAALPTMDAFCKKHTLPRAALSINAILCGCQAFWRRERAFPALWMRMGASQMRFPPSRAGRLDITPVSQINTKMVVRRVTRCSAPLGPCRTAHV